MPEKEFLNINHRNLILSSPRKQTFHFLKLPQELQDRIIDGMDRADMSLHGARKLILENGSKLSAEAISKYYRAVRRRREELLRKVVDDQAS